MLVAGMRAGERRGMAEAQAQQQQQQQQAQLAAAQQAAAKQTAPTQAAAAGKDPVAELQKLADLHKSGVLTDQEFAAAKQKLLS